PSGCGTGLKIHLPEAVAGRYVPLCVVKVISILSTNVRHPHVMEPDGHLGPQTVEREYGMIDPREQGNLAVLAQPGEGADEGPQGGYRAPRATEGIHQANDK